MELQHFLDLLVPLATAGVAFLGVWVRQLTSTIGSLRGALDKLHEDQQREHDHVLSAVDNLAQTLTTEVRGIVNQHSTHDKQNTRIETKIDELIRRPHGRVYEEKGDA